MSDSKSAKLDVDSNSSQSSSGSGAKSPRTQLVETKKELDSTRSKLALLTSQEGLNLFTLLVDDISALVAEKPDGDEMSEKLSTLQTRVEEIKALGLLSGKPKKLTKKATKVKRRSVAKMKPVEDNVDDDLETSATSKPTPTPPEAAGKGQLRSWKKRSNSLREFTTSTESDADSPRSRSGSGLRSWKKRVNALDSASEDDEQQQTASLPSTQLDRPRSESSKQRRQSLNDLEPVSALAQSAPSQPGAGARKWRRHTQNFKSLKNAEEFKRLTEAKYAPTSDQGEEEDPVIQETIKKKTNLRSELLSRLRRSSSATNQIDQSANTDSKRKTTVGSMSSRSLKHSSKASKAIFGKPLADVPASTAVPDFVLLAVSHLEANGLDEDILFDCSDDRAVDELARKIEDGDLHDLASYRYPEVVAGLIKRFLAMLPEPLLSHHLLDNFVSCLAIEKDEDLLIAELDVLLHQLPCRDYSLLRFVANYINTIAITAKVPRALRWRAAIQLGPVLARGTNARRNNASAVLAFIFTHYDQLFSPKNVSSVYVRNAQTDAFVLHAAAPRVLLQRLVSPIWQDTELTRTLLLTYTAFVSPEALVKRFAALLAVPVLQHDEDEKEPKWRLKRATQICRLLRATLPPLPESKDEPVSNNEENLSNSRSERRRRKKRTETDSPKPTSEAPTPQGTPRHTEDDDDDASHSQATVDASESSRMEDSVADTDYLITSPSLRQSLQTFAALSTRYASQCDIVKQLHDDLVSSYLKPLSKSNAVQSTVASIPDSSAAAVAKALWNAYTPAQIAAELTLWDHELYCAIKSNEFLGMAFTQREKAPKFFAASDRFNDASRWAATVVLLPEEHADRVVALQNMIDVAEECRRLKNYQAVFAVICGLQSTPVSRLTDLWQDLPKDYRTSFEKLSELVDLQHNFQNYREALHASPPPIVPYLALISKYIFAIESHNPDFVDAPASDRSSSTSMLLAIVPDKQAFEAANTDAKKAAAARAKKMLAQASDGVDIPATSTQTTPAQTPRDNGGDTSSSPVRVTDARSSPGSPQLDGAAMKSDDEEKLVNYEKLRMLAALLQEVESYQQDAYPIESKPDLRSALRTTTILTDDELFETSRRYKKGRIPSSIVITNSSELPKVDSSDSITSNIDDSEAKDVAQSADAPVDDEEKLDKSDKKKKGKKKSKSSKRTKKDDNDDDDVDDDDDNEDDDEDDDDDDDDEVTSANDEETNSN